MLYDTLGTATCRKAEIADLDAMCQLLDPYLIDDKLHESANAAVLRKANKLLKYYVKNGDALVSETDGVLTGLCAGDTDTITYVASEGSLQSTVLLFKVVLCDIHNRFKESKFVVMTDKQKELFAKLTNRRGPATTIDGDTGIIPVDTKDDLMVLFTKLKG